MIGYQFKPSLIPTLVTLLLLPFFISLGIWQLHRNQQKQEILAQLQLQLKKQPITLTQLPSDETSWQYLPVKINGYFDNSRQFLLDNKIYQGKVGYEVITPITVPGLHKLVLIDRGWIAASNSRQQLPQLQVVATEQTFNGILRLPIGKTFMLTTDQIDPSVWPKRIQSLDFITLEQVLGQPIYHFMVLMDPKAEYGYVRNWKFLNDKPEKHFGYALQWFSFAAILFILYLVLNLRKNKLEQ